MACQNVTALRSKIFQWKFILFKKQTVWFQSGKYAHNALVGKRPLKSAKKLDIGSGLFAHKATRMLPQVV